MMVFPKILSTYSKESFNYASKSVLNLEVCSPNPRTTWLVRKSERIAISVTCPENKKVKYTS